MVSPAVVIQNVIDNGQARKKVVPLIAGNFGKA
jgi:hypothetical protein